MSFWRLPKKIVIAQHGVKSDRLSPRAKEAYRVILDGWNRRSRTPIGSEELIIAYLQGWLEGNDLLEETRK